MSALDELIDLDTEQRNAELREQRKRIENAKRSRRGTLASMASQIASGFAAQPGYEVTQLKTGDEYKIAEASVRIARRILQRIDEVENHEPA